MTDFEQQLRERAASFAYPPTPAIRWSRRQTIAFQRQRTLRWALAGALLLMLVPLYVALEQIRVGMVHIAVDADATLTAPPLALADIPGATTLDDARARFPVPIRLPAALPAPDAVFMQAEDRVVIAAWLSDDGTAIAWLLYVIVTGDGYGYKVVPEILETTVGDLSAVWTTQSHVVMFGLDAALLPDLSYETLSGVLVWEDGAITYRLETSADLETARAVAESLR